MDQCKSLDIHIANGRCGDNSHIGMQTCKNSSVIDVIMSPELFPSIYYIDLDQFLSDIHCPVAFIINVQSQENVTLSNEENSTTDTYSEQNSIFPTWKSESRLEFLNCIQESNLDQIIIDLETLNQSESLKAGSILLPNFFIGTGRCSRKLQHDKEKNTVSVKSQKMLKNQKHWFNKQS